MNTYDEVMTFLRSAPSDTLLSDGRHVQPLCEVVWPHNMAETPGPLNWILGKIAQGIVDGNIHIIS